MARLLSLASGTLPEFGPVDVVHAAAAGGFGGSGIWFDAESWTDATTRSVRAAFDATGLTPLEIEVIAVGPGPLDPQHRRQLEAGAAIGATEAIVVSSHPDPAAFTERFAELCEIGADVGMNLCLEFLPIYRIRNLGEALEVLHAVRHPRAKLLIDPLHVVRSGSSIAAIAELPRELFTFAQWCDGPAELPGEPTFEVLLEDAVDGRLTPGSGGLPLDELLVCLPPGLPLSLELRSRWLRENFPDAAERARHVYQETVRSLPADAR